jgi:hypothetical protein
MMLLQLGSEFFHESALRGRIALPGIETRFQEARIQRRMGCFDPQSMIYDPSSLRSLATLAAWR